MAVVEPYASAVLGRSQGSRTIYDYLISVILLVIAVLVSPVSVRLMVGRVDLSLRIFLITTCLSLFLLAIAGAVFTRNRLRHVFFWSIVLLLPFFLLSGAEGIAAVLHLADRVMPLSDMSVYANRPSYPGYFRSDLRAITYEKDGVLLYRPWAGGGVSINSLGLRTAPPSVKAPGEWRIAVTGGSTAWGQEVVDEDTIAVQLEKILRAQGHANVRVYNFGIGSRVLRDELALLKRFRDVYAIDQVIFYTGGNDSTYWYMEHVDPNASVSELGTWELVKIAQRARVKLFGTQHDQLSRIEREVLPLLRESNPIREGIMAADNYCRSASLRCDYVLQPSLGTRNDASRKDLEMKITLLSLYPRLDAAVAEMYGGAILAAPGRVHDFSRVLDQTTEHVFADWIHVNAAANNLIAQRIAENVRIGPP